MTEKIKVRRGRWTLVFVLLLVNSAAVWGQARWALKHIVPAGWDWRAGLTLALAFAAAIELIGVFLALSADDAEDRDVPSGGIRLASYGIGIVSGALNYSHWDGAAAIAFALLSAISPFLWGINSRVNRARPIAPSRRFWHPVRSVTLIRHMAWEGIALESEGIQSMTSSTPPVGRTVFQYAAPIGPMPASALDVDLDAVLARWTAEQEEGAYEPSVEELALAAELATVSAPPNRGTSRAPRTGGEDLVLRIKKMIETAPDFQVDNTAPGASTLRKYQRVARMLWDDVTAVINYGQLKVSKEIVESVIRPHMNRERVR